MNAHPTATLQEGPTPQCQGRHPPVRVGAIKADTLWNSSLRNRMQADAENT